MLTTFPEELEQIYERLQARKPELPEFYWPNERAVVDVVGTIAFIEGDGLYAFWSNELNQRRIIKSFRKIGAFRVAELLAESRWAEPIIKDCDYSRREEIFGREKMEKFSALESAIYTEFNQVPEKAFAFAKAKKVTGRSLTTIEHWIAWIAFPFTFFVPLILSDIRNGRQRRKLDTASLPQIWPETVKPASIGSNIEFGRVDDGWLKIKLNIPMKPITLSDASNKTEVDAHLEFDWIVLPKKSLEELSGEEFDEDRISEYSVYDQGLLRLGDKDASVNLENISFEKLNSKSFHLRLTIFCPLSLERIAQDTTLFIETEAAIHWEQNTRR